jgi:SAM-dependent methyltransferase
VKNIDNYKPSKFIVKRGKLIASRDRKEVGAGSRMIADITADFYQKYIPKYAHGKLIDLGCGKVPLYVIYKDYVDEVTCVDWGNSIHDTSHVDIYCDLNDTLPFEDNAFDTIILSSVLEHIKNPDFLFSEMNRILRDDGVIILDVPFYYWIHEKPNDYYRFTEYALRGFIQKYNLKLEILESMGGIQEVITDLNTKFFNYFGFIGRAISSIIYQFYKITKRLKLTQMLYNKTKWTFPISYFLIIKK